MLSYLSNEAGIASTVGVWLALADATAVAIVDAATDVDGEAVACGEAEGGGDIAGDGCPFPPHAVKVRAAAITRPAGTLRLFIVPQS